MHRRGLIRSLAGVFAIPLVGKPAGGSHEHESVDYAISNRHAGLSIRVDCKAGESMRAGSLVYIKCDLGGKSVAFNYGPYCVHGTHTMIGMCDSEADKGEKVWVWVYGSISKA